jgi:hypothetical protein
MKQPTRAARAWWLLATVVLATGGWVAHGPWYVVSALAFGAVLVAIAYARSRLRSPDEGTPGPVREPRRRTSHRGYRPVSVQRIAYR